MGNALTEFYDDCEAFHQYMMDEGVKAYRCNDGWVDRDKNVAKFFESEKSPGFYWYGEADVGDKIFIGDVKDFGFYAIVTGIEERRKGVISYKFLPIKLR